MNVQLIESLVKVIMALPEEEQAALSRKLAEAQLATTHSIQSTHVDTGEQILETLIAAGRIIPPAHHRDIPAISEADLKVMVSNIQISGKPLSETVIEERGEW
jgi:phage-related protein